MKKVCMTLLFIFGLSILLIGCNKDKEDMHGNFSPEKAQRIEVVSADDPEFVLRVIDREEDLVEFVNKLEIEKWSIAKVPSDGIKESIYELYQEETVEFMGFERDAKELKKVAAITTYKDIPYITLKIAKLNFSFEVPESAAEFLSQS